MRTLAAILVSDLCSYTECIKTAGSEETSKEKKRKKKKKEKEKKKEERTWLQSNEAMNTDFRVAGPDWNHRAFRHSSSQQKDYMVLSEAVGTVGAIAQNQLHNL